MFVADVDVINIKFFICLESVNLCIFANRFVETLYKQLKKQKKKSVVFGIMTYLKIRKCIYIL